MLQIAREYGVAPHTIDEWPQCWYNRAVLKMQAEHLAAKERDRQTERQRKK